MSQSLIVFLIILVLVAISCATLNVPTYKGEPSDHFDGKRFYNPDGPGMGDFKELMKFNRKNKKAKWEFQEESPSIENTIDNYSEDGKTV